MTDQDKNRHLIEKYPFLLPRNVWTDAEVEDFDFSYCLIKDDIPEGWWKFFGEVLCEDLKEVLVKHKCLDEFRILQCKEKFGELRLYDNGHPEEWYDHLVAWEYISAHTCCSCGKFPVPMMTTGWISSYCEDCFVNIYPSAKNDLKSYLLEPDFDGRLHEYTGYYRFTENGKELHLVDLKPFYRKLGVSVKNLIPYD